MGWNAPRIIPPAAALFHPWALMAFLVFVCGIMLEDNG